MSLAFHNHRLANNVETLGWRPPGSSLRKQEQARGGAGPRRCHARGSGGLQQWQWPAKVIRGPSTSIERIRRCPRASRGAFRQVGTGMRRRTSSVETPAKSQTITTSDATFSRVPPPSASTPGLARHGRPGHRTRVFGIFPRIIVRSCCRAAPARGVGEAGSSTTSPTISRNQGAAPFWLQARRVQTRSVLSG